MKKIVCLVLFILSAISLTACSYESYINLDSNYIFFSKTYMYRDNKSFKNLDIINEQLLKEEKKEIVTLSSYFISNIDDWYYVYGYNTIVKSNGYYGNDCIGLCLSKINIYTLEVEILYYDETTSDDDAIFSGYGDYIVFYGKEKNIVFDKDLNVLCDGNYRITFASEILCIQKESETLIFEDGISYIISDDILPISTSNFFRKNIIYDYNKYTAYNFKEGYFLEGEELSSFRTHVNNYFILANGFLGTKNGEEQVLNENLEVVATLDNKMYNTSLFNNNGADYNSDYMVQKNSMYFDGYLYYHYLYNKPFSQNVWIYYVFNYETYVFDEIYSGSSAISSLRYISNKNIR